MIASINVTALDLRPSKRETLSPENPLILSSRSLDPWDIRSRQLSITLD